MTQDQRLVQESNGYQGSREEFNGDEQAVALYGEPKSVQLSDHASLEDLKSQVQIIQHAMKSVMKDNEHFGVIPGTNKPTLLKPGAEKLSLLFRLAPKYDVERLELENGHREYEVKCTLIHINTGNFIGEGVGSCSTMEKKYRYRKGERTCPECGESAIIKGKKEYGGGWLCYKKKGGCGAKWNDGASEIESQNAGDIENPDIADVYNTVLKMAKKRSHVDAILTATAASDIFTQDIEDMTLPQNKEVQQRKNGTSKKKKRPSSGDNKMWLDEGTKHWDNAEKKVRSGEIEPKELRDHYKVSNANMEHFERLKQDRLAEMDAEFDANDYANANPDLPFS